MKWALGAVLLAGMAVSAVAYGDWLMPPTANHACFDGDPSDFFMYVPRDFEGVRSKPWEGGQYGYVRGPRRVGGEVMYGHLHEGIDIKPLKRTTSGEPLDMVQAAAAGQVVHVSDQPGASNYGRYIVIEHRLDGCSYYTLYAHLRSITVKEGEAVTQGQEIGGLGHTGDGIDRERSHVHFEVCLLNSSHFQNWYDRHFKGSPNKHGIFNGMNLMGMDAAALLRGVHQNPQLTIPEFLRNQKPHFRITVNDSPDFELIRRYPWLVPDGEVASAPAWTVSFNGTGVPISVTAAKKVTSPVVEWLVSDVPPSLQSRGWIAGSASSPQLTSAGKRFLELLTLEK